MQHDDSKKPELGQWYTVKAYAYKQNIGAENETGYPLKTEWCNQPYDEPIQAMFIGKRTVQEGVTDTWLQGDWEYGYDEYFGFQPKKYISVWLFVHNMKENPFYAFPDDVELIETSEV